MESTLKPIVLQKLEAIEEAIQIIRQRSQMLSRLMTVPMNNISATIQIFNGNK